MSECEHCSCNRVKSKRCCYCHKESDFDQKRLEHYLKGRIIKPKGDEDEDTD